MITAEMRRDSRWITTKEAGQLVRKVLKNKYPDHKFFVQTRHHTSVNVYWMDGPSKDEIEAICDVGSIFGVDMTDYAYSGYHWLNPDSTVTPAYCHEQNLDNPKPHPDSELVKFHSNYFSAHRVLSEEKCKEIAEETQINNHPYKITAYDWQPGTGTKVQGKYYTIMPDWNVWESEHQMREFRRLIRERSYYTPKGSKNGKPPTNGSTPVNEITISHEGDWTWIKFPNKPDQETRQTLKETLNARFSGKRLAWYIRDIITTEEIKNALGDPSYPQKNTPAAKQQKTAGDPKLAERMRKTADNMSKTIDQKLNPAIADQNPTPRRARIAQGMYEDGIRLQKIQAILYALADMQEQGTTPPEFTDLKSKKAVEDSYWKNKEALNALIDGQFTPPDPKEQQLKQLIQEARFAGYKGYFPTPDAVINKMLDYVQIEEGTKALEPSAGSGNIADKMRELGAVVDVCEVVYDLRKILELKGYQLNGYDFMEHTKEGYQVIMMNPPFENSQDILHVMHAWNLLAEGGTLVSIMSEGPFFREDKKSIGFRYWLNHRVNGYSEKLPEGSFTESGTNVNARLVVIEK